MVPPAATIHTRGVGVRRWRNAKYPYSYPKPLTLGGAARLSVRPQSVGSRKCPNLISETRQSPIPKPRRRLRVQQQIRQVQWLLYPLLEGGGAFAYQRKLMAASPPNPT